MSQKRKKSGDLFEIPLIPHFNLYAYAKYIDVTKYMQEANYPDILRVYNFFSTAPVHSFELIDNRDLLFNPMYIAGGYGMAKSFKIIGHEPVSPEGDFPRS